MHKFLLTALVAIAISGCSTTFGKCQTGLVQVSVDSNGNVLYDPIMRACQGPVSSGSLSDGPMARKKVETNE